jgi:hypothetical protein
MRDIIYEQRMMLEKGTISKHRIERNKMNLEVNYFKCK